MQVGRSDARAFADQAVEAYEAMLRETPTDRGLRFGLARARYVLADWQVQSGDPGEGNKEVNRVIELLEGLIAEESGNGQYLLTLARSCDLRAAAEGQQGHVESALAHNRRVLEILVEATPRMGYTAYLVQSRRDVLYHVGFQDAGFRPDSVS